MKNIILFLTFAFVTVGCTTSSRIRKEALPPAQSATPQAQAELQQAESDLKRNPVQALKKLETLVQKYPNTTVSSDAAKIAGDYYWKQNKHTQAVNAYSYILSNNTLESYEGEVLLKSIKVSLDSNDHNKARALVNTGLRIGNLPFAQKNELLRLKFELEKGSLSSEEQLLLLHDMYTSAPSDEIKTNYLLRANSVADSISRSDELNKVLSNSKLVFVHPGIHFRLGMIAFEQGNASSARSHFSRVNSLSPESEIAETARDYIRQLDARSSVDSKTIGVILPLSGRYADIGKSVLNSLQLGLGIYDRKTPIRLAVIDSEGKYLDARRAVEKLVIEDKAIAIIGSLQSKTATAISSKAQSLGVPTIVLSQKSGITDIGDFIFRNALTSEMQVDHIVKTAIEKMGYTRFAILYPEDAYGTEYANLFWDAVTKYGGQIRAAQSYDPKETDFRAPIQKIVGTYYTDDRLQEYKHKYEEWKKKYPTQSARNEVPRDLLPPIVDFQAVFIPDNTRALGQIAAMLSFQDVSDVALLGTNIWNTPSIIERAGGYNDRLVFVDSFLSTDEQFLKSDFVQRYQQLFKKHPTLFDLQAYDTAVILRNALNQSSSRYDLQQTLSRLSVGGALNTINTTEGRDFTRPIISLTVHGGKIVRFEDLPANSKNNSKKN